MSDNVLTIDMDAIHRLEPEDKREVGKVLEEYGRELQDSADRLDRLRVHTTRLRALKAQRMIAETFPC